MRKLRLFRRLALLIAFVSIAVCVVLLLNFTAPNPTGRRYSSRVPLTTGQASGPLIGLEGEEVLADDLRLPRNDSAGQLQCVCGNQSAPPGRCNACFVSSPAINTYRIPDFIGSGFIAESKNVQTLAIDTRDFEQISDIAAAALSLEQPLWVYVRVNTLVESPYLDVVRQTGGDVLYYFAVPGYVDPVDGTAGNGLIVSTLMFGGLGAWEVFSLRRRTPRQPAPYRTPNPIPTAKRPIDEAEELIKRRKDRLRGDLDR